MMLSCHKQLLPLFSGFLSQQYFVALMYVTETGCAQPRLRKGTSQ